MSSIVNKVKEVLHSDKDKTTHTEGTHSTHHTTHTGTSEPRVHTAQDTTTGANVGGTDNYTHGTGVNRGTDGPATKTDGPHSSNLMNKADPRVDSDRDHSKNLGMNPSGTATTGTGAPVEHHSHAVRGNEAGFADTAGAGMLGTGATGTTGTTGTHHHTTHTGAGAGAGAGAFGGSTLDTDQNRGLGGPATRTDGPHSSNLANKADPRVDSDRDHSRNLGANPQGSATTGTTIGTHGTHGTHVGTTGTHGTHTGTTGTHGTHTGTTGTAGTGAFGANTGSAPGPAPNTAGPHKSDLLNKADPRVDSDLDGSKTVGGNKTYAQPQ